jgi:putative SOS response-associated peptidase YedK
VSPSEKKWYFDLLPLPMLDHFETLGNAKLKESFGVEHVQDPGRLEVWPGDTAYFIRHRALDNDNVSRSPSRVPVLACFGLIPHWATDARIGLHACTARLDHVAEKPVFRDVWRKAQHCIIPVAFFIESGWHEGKAVLNRLGQEDEAPMGLAGLWSCWEHPKGQWVYSFALLTAHSARISDCQTGPRGNKDIVPIVLPPQGYDEWLQLQGHDRLSFLENCVSRSTWPLKV